MADEVFEYFVRRERDRAAHVRKAPVGRGKLELFILVDANDTEDSDVNAIAQVFFTQVVGDGASLGYCPDAVLLAGCPSESSFR